MGALGWCARSDFRRQLAVAGRLGPAGQCYREAIELYRGNVSCTPLDLANAIRPLAMLEEARALYASVDVQAGVAECSERIGTRRE